MIENIWLHLTDDSVLSLLMGNEGVKNKYGFPKKIKINSQIDVRLPLIDEKKIERIASLVGQDVSRGYIKLSDKLAKIIVSCSSDSNKIRDILQYIFPELSN